MPTPTNWAAWSPRKTARYWPKGCSNHRRPARRSYNASFALTEAGISAEVAPGLWFSQYAEPAGVVGIMVPWNGPVALFIRSLGPALAAGDTVAVKMPGQTALVANRLSQIIAEVESLPTGVVNIFTESGNNGAPYLVESPDVQVISYTGSVPVGRIVAAEGAPTLKRMNLELGGKTPMIVFNDADVERAVPLLTSAVTTFAGEFCMTGSRILVQRGVADEVRKGLKQAFENIRLGDGLDPATDMGPLIDKPNVARVDGMVEAALAYAKPIVRGGPATEGTLAKGAFFRPALLEVDDVNTEIVQKEVFGPVATFEVFDTEADAIARANATEMGLAAGIYTENLAISRRVTAAYRPGPSGPTRGPRSTMDLPRVATSKAGSVACVAPSASRTSRSSKPSFTTSCPRPTDSVGLSNQSSPSTSANENRRGCECKSHRGRRRVAPESLVPRCHPSPRRLRRHVRTAEHRQSGTQTDRAVGRTSHGPQAFFDNLNNLFSCWENQAFNVTTMFASGEDVAAPPLTVGC